jgi:hypothetical protein
MSAPRKSQWEQHLWENYRIRGVQYSAILEAQDGRCAICGKFPTIRRLHVDHSHATGKIRGLLCHKCNVGLGHFNDDSDLLLKASEYLKK